MRLRAALTGDLRRIMEAETRAAEGAVSAGIREATNGLKDGLRGQIEQAGMGRRLARSWRGNVYPKSGTNIEAAGYVYSKAPDIVRAFDRGVTIASTSGRFLAIPTEAAGKTRQFEKRMTPAAWERRNGMRLRFVYRRGAPSLLVADNVRLTGRGLARANTGKRRGALVTRLRNRATAVIFVLVPQVTLRKRLDVERETRAWGRRLDGLIVKHWREVS